MMHAMLNLKVRRPPFSSPAAVTAITLIVLGIDSPSEVMGTPGCVVLKICCTRSLENGGQKVVTTPKLVDASADFSMVMVVVVVVVVGFEIALLAVAAGTDCFCRDWRRAILCIMCTVSMLSGRV